MDQSSAFWPAGTKAIAKVDPPVTVSISPLDNKVAKPNVSAKRELEKTIKTNEAEETKERKIEVEATKGRKDEVEEGRVGKKGRASKSKKNLEKKLLKKPLWLEDESLLEQRGQSTKYANTKLPADP